MLVFVAMMVLVSLTTSCGYMNGYRPIATPANVYSPNYQFWAGKDNVVDDPTDLADVRVFAQNDTQFLMDVAIDGIHRGRVQPGEAFRYLADGYTRNSRATVMAVKIVQPQADGRLLVIRSFSHSLGYLGTSGKTTIVWRFSQVRSWNQNQQVDVQDSWETTY